MQIELIERDIRDREIALQKCKGSILYFKEEEQETNKSVIDVLSQEVFFLDDQLYRYRILLDLLKEEQEPSYEIPKRI